MIYLATPIKSPDPLVESWRVQVATRAAASLHDAGIPVFSPATHGYGFARLATTRQGWDYWSRIDLPILLNCCSMLVVLELDGWRESQGVQAEIRAASGVMEPEPVVSVLPVVGVRWCTECSGRLEHHNPHTTCKGYPSVMQAIRHLIAGNRI